MTLTLDYSRPCTLLDPLRPVLTQGGFGCCMVRTMVPSPTSMDATLSVQACLQQACGWLSIPYFPSSVHSSLLFGPRIGRRVQSRVTLEPRDASAAHHPDIAVEDNAILNHVDVSIVEPTSEHAISANIAAATTKGAAAASKETVS